MNAPQLIDEEARAFLREYYGKTLQCTEDLSEKACCTEATASKHKETLSLLPDEVFARHYGCGCPLPEDDLTGLVGLDLNPGACGFRRSMGLVGHAFCHGLCLCRPLYRGGKLAQRCIGE